MITGTILACFAFTSGLFSQCSDTADFNFWSEVQGNQIWEVLSEHQVWEAEEIFPVIPTFFVSNGEFINVRFSFDVVSRNGMDNDFIGFVMGYNSPLSGGSANYEMVLLDWKAETESAFNNSAQEGFNLSAFHGNIPESQVHKYFWGHNGLLPNTVITPIAHIYGDSQGWSTGKTYHFEVLYSTGSIKIDLDGSRLFDIRRCNQPGRIGFYTYSQRDVVFSNFTWESAADAFIFPPKICLGDTTYYSLEDTLCGGYNPLIQDWRWIFGDGDSISNTIGGYHVFNAPGDYSINLIAEFPGGCLDTVISQVNVQVPLTVDLGQDTILPAHSNITLTAGSNLNGYHYLWSTGSVLNQLTLWDIDRDTSVNVMVTSGNCEAYDEIRISIKKDLPPLPDTPVVFIPNAFSPNGDGINEMFMPVFGEENPREFIMVIFDRWGQELFSTEDIEKGWDGKLNGKDCPCSVYIYIIKFESINKDQNAQLISKKGNFLLIR